MSRFEKPVVPGEVVDANVQSRVMTYKEFAELCEVPPWAVTQLVLENRRITPRWAVGLEKGTGISAMEWLEMQARWDLWKFLQQDFEDGYCVFCLRIHKNCKCRGSCGVHTQMEHV